jgi:hypothetical protein
VPPSPTPDSDDDIAGAQATGEADDDEDDGADNLTAPANEDDPPPSPTSTNTPTPTATFTATPTITPTPIPCAVSLSDGELDFGEGASSLGLTIELNDCGEALAFSMTSSEPWIDVNPSGGTLPPGDSELVSIDIDRGSLSPGTYSEQIQFVSSLGALVIPVLVEVEPPACVVEIDASPGTLDYGETESSLLLTVSLSNCGSDPVAYKLTPNRSWIAPTSGGGTLQPGDSDGVIVRILRSDRGLSSPGRYSGQIEVDSAVGTIVVQVLVEVPSGGRIP